MSTAEAAWYVIQAKARAEQKICGLLSGTSVRTFLPHLLVRHRHGSRRWQAPEPLFPGYVFAHFVPAPETIHRIRWAPGVRRLLGDEEAPVSVPDEVVRYLQDREGDRGFIVPGQQFRPGMRVRFRSGPLALLEGIIERPASRADRVRVLLTLVNTPVAVEVHIDELVRV